MRNVRAKSHCYGAKRGNNFQGINIVSPRRNDDRKTDDTRVYLSRTAKLNRETSVEFSPKFSVNADSGMERRGLICFVSSFRRAYHEQTRNNRVSTPTPACLFRRTCFPSFYGTTALTERRYRGISGVLVTRHRRSNMRSSEK